MHNERQVFYTDTQVEEFIGCPANDQKYLNKAPNRIIGLKEKVRSSRSKGSLSLPAI